MTSESFLLAVYVMAFVSLLLVAAIVAQLIESITERSKKNYHLAIAGSVLQPRKSLLKTFMEKM